MKRAALILAALAAILTAAAAPVRTATENFVTNKIAEAVAAIPAPDYSTNNTALVETIQAKAPAPDLSPFLRKDLGQSGFQEFGGFLSGMGFHVTHEVSNFNGWNNYTAKNGPTQPMQSLPSYIESNPWGFLKLDGDNVLTVPTLTVGARVGGSTIGERSVAEGFEVTASGTTSHAEGDSTSAMGNSAHAEGLLSTAWGPNSHAEGYDTQTQNNSEHAQGRCNLSHTGADAADQTISSIGIGGGNRDRKNAVETMRDGKTFIYGLGGYDGTNPTNGVKDLVAAIEGKADAADIPEWAKAPTKPTYTASEVGAYSTAAIDAILQGYLPLDYFRDGQTIPMYWGDGTKLCDFGANWLGNLAAGVQNNSDAINAISDDIPPAVSNIVTTALVRERLGVYLYVGADGGIYVHTNED